MYLQVSLIVFIMLSNVLHAEAEEDDYCFCYSPSADHMYRLPYESSTWPPYRIEVCKNFFLKSIKDDFKISRSIEYVDFSSDYDEYCQLHSKYYERKSAIDSKYAAVKWRNGPTYPSRMQALYEYEHELKENYYDWWMAHENFLLTHKKCGVFSGCHTLGPKAYQEHIDAINKKKLSQDTLRAEKKRLADQLFHQIAAFCMQKHVNLRTYFEHSLHELNRGKFASAMQTTKKLIEHSLKKNKRDFLKAETYLRLGIACSMSFEYGQAIESLTEALKHDPGNSEAYVERAIAYFELGDFEKAISDFISSGKEAALKLPDDPYKIQFGQGLLKGAGAGLMSSASELPSTLLYSLKGMGQLLWAGITHPIDTSQEMIDTVTASIEYLRQQDLSVIAKDMAPELHELLTKWDTFDSMTRGEKTGFVLGKYGINILCAYGGAKAAKVFMDLRQANALSNLKTLTTSQSAKQAVVEAAHQAAEFRAQVIKNAYLHHDKQGKHIVGHINFKPDSKKSILSHSDPETLLRNHAGKGTPLGKSKAGDGFKEAIDFKEHIGEFFDKKTSTYLPTTRGKIHYDTKGGAHIVPAPPEPPL